MTHFVFNGWSDPNLWGTAVIGSVLFILFWSFILNMGDIMHQEPVERGKFEWVLGLASAVGITLQFGHSVENGLFFCLFMFFFILLVVLISERISHGRNDI